MKHIKSILARRRLAKSYKPRKEFVENTRDIFLKAAHAQFGHQHVRYSSVRPFARGLAVGIATMLLIGSVTTYADQSNVSPASMLYPLKRANETVRLSFTDQERKPAYHAELAERRLDEFEKENVKLSTTRAEQLALEVGEEMEKSLIILEVIGIPEPIVQSASQTVTSFVSAGLSSDQFSAKEFVVPAPLRAEKTREFTATRVVEIEHPACRSLARLMQKKTLAIAQALEKHERLEERFKKLCEREEEED